MKDNLDKIMWEYAVAVLRDVAVQTHTNWEVYLDNVMKKYKDKFKTL